MSWQVSQLIGQLKSGAISLPDLQRPFVWPNTKVRDLLDSMYRGYPVGELMFWDVPADGETKAIAHNANISAQHQIVDGQQRLTSLFAVFTGQPVFNDDYRTRVIRIAFNPFDERFEVPNVQTNKSAYWIPDIAEFLTDSFKGALEFIRKFEEAEGELDLDAQSRLSNVFSRLSGILNYQFDVIHIQSEVEKRTVADIFVRINSEGVNLKSYDYILTWFSVFWPEGREQLEKFARNSRLTVAHANDIASRNGSPKLTWTAKNHYIDVETGQLVRVLIALGQNRAKLSDSYSALQAKDRSSGAADIERQERELGLLKDAIDDVLKPLHWDEFINCLPVAGFRSRKGITSETNLISTYVIWLLGRLRFKVPLHDLRNLIARWFFMSQLSSRYTGSGETQLQRDLDRFDRIKARDAEQFTKVVNEVCDSVLTPDYWSYNLPDLLISSNAALSPVYQCYLAALNILDADMFMLNMGVREWMDPTREPVRGLEGHHLFPRAYQRDVLGIEDLKLVNQAANFAPTDWDTNGIISDRAPAEYWPELVAERGKDPAWMKKQMEWHALPEGWVHLDYEEFLTQRRRLISEVTRKGYGQLRSGQGAEIQLASSLFEDSSAEEVTVASLVEINVLAVGDSIVPIVEGNAGESVVTEDGTLLVMGQKEFDTFDEAARWLNITNISGIDYFAKISDAGMTPISALVPIGAGF